MVWQVDKSRVNEFGESFEEKEKKEVKEHQD
jgi:hypothetical protein